MTLNPRLQELRDALDVLRAHAQEAGLIVEDDRGGRWAIARAYPVGARTTDPGLVLRLVQECADDHPHDPHSHDADGNWRL